MSSSDVPDPNLDDGGSMLSWSAGRINDGWGIGKFVKSGLGLLIAGVFALVFDVLEAIATFVTDPLGSASTAIGDLFEGLISDPTSILSDGATAAGDGIIETFTGWLAPLAFPVAVGSVLLGLYLVTTYLEESETSDLFPGSFTDIDVPDVLSGVLPDPGVQEEGETDEARD